MRTLAVARAPAGSKSRRVVCLFSLLVIGAPAAKSQSRNQITNEATGLLKLVESGRYEEAAKISKSILERASRWPKGPDEMLIRTYLGKASLELGAPRAASKILEAAPPRIPLDISYHIEQYYFRERAAVRYAVADYEGTLAEAAQAIRVFHEQEASQTSHDIREDYCRSLQALALLRMGKQAEAEALALKAAKAVPKKLSYSPVYTPRILYAACVVESYSEEYDNATRYCALGAGFAAKSKRETRDRSLGQLALAEMHLLEGDLAQAREAAQLAADLTRRMFGTRHQDMVDALNLLAKINLREGDLAAAHANASEALNIANIVFGEGSPAANISLRIRQEIDAASRSAKPATP